MSTKAVHGGASFSAIGTDFSDLSRRRAIIDADVLDAWFEPSPKVLAKLREHLEFALRTSPPMHADGLIKTISDVRHISKETILVGGGSSDLMFAAFPKLVSPGDSVLVLDPMYGEYAHIFSNVIAARLIRYHLTEEAGFRPSVAGLVSAASECHAKFICLVNPNNPTGVLVSRAEILDLCDRLPETIIVVDESYIDFVGQAHSVERDVQGRENLIVIKSMSKAYALSGARVAYMACPARLREQIDVFIPPWSVGLPAQIAGVEALRDENYYRTMYHETKKIKNEMSHKLATSNTIRVFPSEANFLFMDVTEIGAANLVQRLADQNIFIRNCESMGENLANRFVRSAVKSPDQSRRLVDAIVAAEHQ